MRFIHFKVPAGTNLDSPLVAAGMEHFTRVSGLVLSPPYFAQNEDDATDLNVYAHEVGRDDA